MATDFEEWLTNTQKVKLFLSPTLEEYSRPGETEADFRARLQLISREERDRFSDDLKKKYASKLSRLDEQIDELSLL